MATLNWREVPRKVLRAFHHPQELTVSWMRVFWSVQIVEFSIQQVAIENFLYILTSALVQMNVNLTELQWTIFWFWKRLNMNWQRSRFCYILGIHYSQILGFNYAEMFNDHLCYMYLLIVYIVIQLNSHVWLWTSVSFNMHYYQYVLPVLLCSYWKYVHDG